MKKSDFNATLRQYVKEQLSPREKERNLVTKIYESFQALLGESNCLKIGSYPRFTAIRPLHDLDILFIVGQWTASTSHPSKILGDLQRRIQISYKNPTEYSIEILSQTHSITILFLKGKEEFFSIDVVPAYILGKNEFGDDMYMVPEILSKNHRARKHFYENLEKSARRMNWIKSDPRGYIEVAKRVNDENNDFRKSVKFVKAWRVSCKELGEEFKLKSFHIEQVITQYFIQDGRLEIYDAVFRFFCDLPILLVKSQIPDRADTEKKIDDYIDNLTSDEKETIKRARDFFLIKLENFSEGFGVGELLKAGFHKRASDTEEYLFDTRIPTLLEKDEAFNIRGRALPRGGGFREKILDAMGLIDADRKIEFRVTRSSPNVDLYKWKVKNDNRSAQPRGEITDHSTRNDPEYTRYNGKHFVECYAIKNGVCIGRAKQNVELRSLLG